MSEGEVAFLIMVIAAMTVFAAVLAWSARGKQS